MICSILLLGSYNYRILLAITINESVKLSITQQYRQLNPDMSHSVMRVTGCNN